MWYHKFDTYVLCLGFLFCKSDHCIYSKSNDDGFLVISLYVNDMFFIGKGKGLIVELKSQLLAKFEMKDLGVANYILGMETIRDRKKKALVRTK